MLNFVAIENSNDKVVKKNERYLSLEEEKLCFLQNITENIQRNVLLYNVLSDESFHTLVGNLANHDVNLEVLIYGKSLWYNKKLAEKILKINFPFYIVSRVDVLYERKKDNALIIHSVNNEDEVPVYFISIPLVIDGGSISVNNENDSVTLQLQCKPYKQQTITIEERKYGFTVDGEKWIKYLEAVLQK